MDRLDPRSTALVLIDLQKGILARPTAPYTADQVVAAGVSLARAWRAAEAPVVLVRVGWSDGMVDALRQPTEQQMPAPPGGLPPGWMDYVPELEMAATDILVTKRQWGAFYGTELDLQLRRRGVTRLVLGGVSTNFGVESTARFAWEQNYALIFAEDAMSAYDGAMHQFAVTNIFPRLGLIRKTEEVLAAFG
ncbi:MAG TPA: hydrolase [Aliidongia sp.]|nr:hydrolase [Aliidongia sp.]